MCLSQAVFGLLASDRQDMQQVLFPAVLPEIEQRMFLSLIRRVSQHKFLAAIVDSSRWQTRFLG